MGEPVVPVVSTGDLVRVGQLIGDVPAGMTGCPVHASVSGTVTAIEEAPTSDGETYKTVVIENDGKDEICDSVVPYTDSIRSLTPQDITERLRLAGICEYGKIMSSRGKSEYLIVNCAESEPFVTADHRLLLERTMDIIRGVKILMRAVGAPQAYIALEDNKMKVARRLREALGRDKLISVKVLKTKYPQSDESQLIFALTGRELPDGKLPSEAGCVIFSAATCADAYTAIASGMPSVRRVITVSGDCVATPKNLSVPVGTPASFLVEYCGGLVKTPMRLISGGAMTGQAQEDPDMPVDKSTSAILLLSEEYSKKPSYPAVCIRCGRCVAGCPMGLMPAYISTFAQRGDVESAERYGAMSCIECGSCSYVCPGKVDVTEHIRRVKDRIRAAEAASEKN